MEAKKRIRRTIDVKLMGEIEKAFGDCLSWAKNKKVIESAFAELVKDKAEKKQYQKNVKKLAKGKSVEEVEEMIKALTEYIASEKKK